MPSVMELTVHANPNYFTCGIYMANPLISSDVELIRVEAE